MNTNPGINGFCGFWPDVKEADRWSGKSVGFNRETQARQKAVWWESDICVLPEFWSGDGRGVSHCSTKGGNVTVDSVPWYIRPLFWVYGYGLGSVIYLLLRLIRLSYRVETVGVRYLNGEGGLIQTMWHHNNLSFFILFSGLKKHIWMNHPAWYMKAVHVMMKLMGVEKIALGSTGNSGRKAADIVTEHLKHGYSTFINPDGPAGPPEVLKKGVLHIAAQSGAPVLPVTIETPCSVRLPGWDAKRLALPFSKVRVIYKKPVIVTYENMEKASLEIVSSLGLKAVRDQIRP